ncbi:MAG TPA: hypothetical protein VM597_24695, partial [Gemmataceae bacterium]|nr:hypothetical protein [Gemmataceae bacterium]
GWRFRPADVAAFAAARERGGPPAGLLADGLDPPDPARLALFAAVVECWQDGLPKGLARAVVARRLGIPQAEVRRAEAEGVAKKWPPLRD